MFKSVANFISYWYFRYTLVTELYMVEKWERMFMHVFFAVTLLLLWLFNVKVVLGLTGFLTAPIFAALDLFPKSHVVESILQNEASQNILTEL